MFIKTLKETAERTKKEFEVVQGSLKLANEAYAAAVQKYGKNSAEAQVAADKLNKVGEAYQAALRTAADAHNRLQEVEAMRSSKATGALDVFIMALEQAANNTRNHYEKMKAELVKAGDAYTDAVKQWGEDSDEAKKAAADLETARSRYEAALNSAALASSKFADAQAKQKAAAAPTAPTAPTPTTTAPSADGGGAVAYLKNMAAVVSDAIKNGIGGSLEYLKGITSTVGQAVRSNLGTAFEKTAVTLAPVARVATGLGTAFAGVTTAGLNATTTLTTFGKSLSDAGANALRQPMQVLDTAISAVQTNVVRFVSNANPAAVQLFTMAIDDLQAVIGQALLPVLKIATDVFRSVGSMIYGLNGEGKKLIAAVAAGTIGLIAFGAAMVLIQTITTGGIMPIIGALTGVLGGFFAVFQGGAIKSAIDRVMKILGGVMEQVGAAIDRLAPAMEPVFSILEEIGGLAAAGVAAIAQVWANVAPVFVQLMGVGKKLFDAVRPLIDLGLEMYVGAMTGVINGLAMALEFLMPFIEAVIKGIKMVADMIAFVVRSIGELLGLGIGFGTELQAPKSALQKNEGTSVKSASFSDPTADLKKAITSAMSIGLGAQPPEQKTADGVTKIVGQLSPLQGLVNTVKDWLGKIGGYLDGIWGTVKSVWDFIKDIPQKIADAIRSLIPGVSKGGPGLVTQGIGAGVSAVAGESAGNTAKNAFDRVIRNLPSVSGIGVLRMTGII